MNHAVVSVINAAPAKVRCRTCHSDHDYRHEQAPPPKVDARKAALFQEVLKKVSPDGAVPDADVEEVAGIEIEPDTEVLADADEPEMVMVEEAPPVEEAPKPKAKAKGRAKK